MQFDFVTAKQITKQNLVRITGIEPVQADFQSATLPTELYPQ